MLVAGYEQIVENSKMEPAQETDARLVLDARSRGRCVDDDPMSSLGIGAHVLYSRFLGTDPEPRPGLSSGHMPYSLSLPFSAFLKTNTISGSDKTYTTLLPPEEIRFVIEENLGRSIAQQILEGKRKITATCGR